MMTLTPVWIYCLTPSLTLPKRMYNDLCCNLGLFAMTRLTDDQAVRAVQIWMRDEGFYNGAIDGDWGPLTNTAWGEAAPISSWLVKPVEPRPRNAGGLVRIIMHWTAGSYTVGDAINHYHFVIDSKGSVVPGKLKPEDNIVTSDGVYTPHTLNANTGSIGVAMAAMADAVEHPFQWGKAPLLRVQVDAMVNLVADLCEKYAIVVDRRTVLTHAEVQPTLGIKQRGKWDISILPGMTRPENAISVGDTLRFRILSKIRS